VLQALNHGGLTVVMVTHEPDIAQFARRTIMFRDGRIRKDEPSAQRLLAQEVLKTLPALDD
jgi:putative ABC transport system ATP-binding protein